MMPVLIKSTEALLTLRFQIIGPHNRSTCDSQCEASRQRNPSCFDILMGSAATNHYHVIIVDNDLPGLSGLELVLRARSLSHRRHTPIIMLSGDDCEREAWRAGVAAFLLKPKSVDKISSTIDRLLQERRKKRK